MATAESFAWQFVEVLTEDDYTLKMIRFTGDAAGNILTDGVDPVTMNPIVR